MSFRKPFSKVREKVKHGLSKIGEKLEREGANIGGKESDRSALSLQSEGEVRGEDSKTGGGDDPVSQLVVGGGRDLGETSQSDPHLHPRVEVQADAPRSDVGIGAPSTSRDGDPEGM